MRIAQSALSITLQNTYWHLKVNNLIEYFIVKLEQIFVFGDNNQTTCSRVVTYIYIYIRIRGQSPRKLVNFLCELKYFYWKISYFGKFLYTAPGQPGRGAKTLSGGPAPPPAPRWLRPCIYMFILYRYMHFCTIYYTLYFIYIYIFIFIRGSSQKYPDFVNYLKCK